MSDAREIVGQYLEALYRGDVATARHHLADDVKFSAPAATLRGADAVVKAAQHAARAVKAVEQRKVFVDGSDVCVFYDLLLDHRVARIAVAEWHQLRGEKIASIRVLLDTAPFMQAGASANDPVCHMNVSKATAAAVRVHRGTSYYFCNVGCAEAFEREPERYV